LELKLGWRARIQSMAAYRFSGLVRSIEKLTNQESCVMTIKQRMIPLVTMASEAPVT